MKSMILSTVLTGFSALVLAACSSHGSSTGGHPSDSASTWRMPHQTTTVARAETMNLTEAPAVAARGSLDRLDVKGGNEVKIPFRVTFTPQQVGDNAAVIWFYIDTEGLDWWPSGCGPRSGYKGCPDFLMMFNVEQQVIGSVSEGLHQVTAFNDSYPEEGELFVFAKESDPSNFERAKQCLKDGTFVCWLRVDESNAIDTIHAGFGVLKSD